MSKLFSYADVNAESIAAVIEVAPQFVDTTTPPDGLGFTLVNDNLVSNTFLEEVYFELQHTRLNCFDVTRVSDLFGKRFLDSLAEPEMDVLGECVLMLLERGEVPISLIDTKKAA
jgi:hypothetical protein